MTKATILIVEDEAITSMALKSSLEDMGYSVCGIARAGELAVQKAEELKPDLIMMDIMLAGEMTGIEAAEEIRKNYHIPVIFLTAFSDDQYINEAKLTEPYGYILKPVREQELKTTIAMAFYKNAMDRIVREQAEIIRVLLNETRDLHFLIDRDGSFIAVNEALAKRAGRGVDELIGSAVSEMVESGYLSPTMAGKTLPPIMNYSLKYEEEFAGSWYDIGIHPIFDPDGTVRKYAVHIHDTSKMKVMEERLRKYSDMLMKRLFPGKSIEEVSLDDLGDLDDLVTSDFFDDLKDASQGSR